MKNNTGKAIIWLRRDLRIFDNPAIFYASEQNLEILPIYIIDENEQTPLGSASKWWLHHSLLKLNQSFEGSILYFKGNPYEILCRLLNEYECSDIYWNRCYDPYSIKRDKLIKQNLANDFPQIRVKSFNSSLLREPHEIKNNSGENYKVFSPFYKNAYLQNLDKITLPIDRLPHFTCAKIKPIPEALTIEELELLPKINWAENFSEYFTPGEEGAKVKFYDFLENGLDKYKENRNRPDLEYSTSRLSPHLQFGEISIRQIWHKIYDKYQMNNFDDNYLTFLSELVWREFSYYTLFHFRDLKTQNWRSNYDAIKWKNKESDFKKWKHGNTGFPIVDAGMRQLWQTGYMHNRVRMICASFLVKNLLVDWREGEKWFWDCLLDADPASNPASWQWVAGSGADAAPYFRIFNPILQSEKFDPEGKYIKKYLPELRNLDVKYIHQPYKAGELFLKNNNIEYPKPMINLDDSRKAALAAYSSVKDKPNQE